MAKYLFPILVISSLLTACYEMPVPQGNTINKDTAGKIKTGMSSKQVIAALGDPVMTNSFNDGRINYVYSYKPGYKPLEVKKIVVWFSKDKVKKVTTTG